MKKIFFVILIFILAFILAMAEQRIEIPADFKVEKNVFKETLVRNLADEEIFELAELEIYDDNIYFCNGKPLEIVKLNLNGKVRLRGGRQGQGPGEFNNIVCVKKIDKNFITFDIMNKFLIFDNNLKFIREFKVPKFFFIFIINKNNELVVCQSQAEANQKYFAVYNLEGKLLRIFGGKKTAFKPGKFEGDWAFCVAYDRDKDGLWAAYLNRYDLRYYENEKLKVELITNKNFFKKIAREERGIKFIDYGGKPIRLVKSDNNLFYFYRKDKKFFCDIIDTKKYQLMRRIKLNNYFRRIAYYRENIFYAIYYGNKGEEDLQLFKVTLQN